jgi:hypothetical protein
MVTNKAQGITHNIKQLGFSGLRAFVFQTNFSNGGYERAPKIQPFHIVKRYLQAKRTTQNERNDKSKKEN